MAVAAACFRAKLAGQPAPAGERTARVLAGYRGTAGERGRAKRARLGSRTSPPCSRPVIGLVGVAVASSPTGWPSSAGGSMR